MAICVKSEIGRLRKVLLHRPGKELEHLTPQELERLLFDDIPYLKLAKSEHDTFADILRENGVEVVYLEDLMAETLRAVPGLKDRFIEEFIAEAGPSAQVHKDEIVRTSIYEKDNTIYTYYFDTFTTNVAINDSTFKFNAAKYPGVEINDMR